MSKKLTKEEFIEKSTKVHGNKYDYSLVSYKSSKEKVKIKCPEHGIFFQAPKNHYVNKSGCPKCGIESACKKQSLKKDLFIKKANKIHRNKYDYSLVDYKNAKTKVKIICPKHDIFEQSPSNHNHKKKYGCSKCAGNNKLTKEEFINKSKVIHGNKYGYNLVKYIDSKTKVKIICLEHGTFEQTPSNHLHDSCGCPSCRISKGEKNIISFLNENKINYIFQHSFDDCKHKKKLIFDFYIPKKNLLIEYDGKQHFEPEDFFGGKDAFMETKKRDNIKSKYAKANNIKLLRIPYTSFHEINEILKGELN